MFGIIESLTKAVVGVVIETPVAIVADTLTMGGILTDREVPYTSAALENIVQNVENATNPNKE
jgi:hypothetical protein